jgi:hypothetical protein
VHGSTLLWDCRERSGGTLRRWFGSREGAVPSLLWYLVRREAHALALAARQQVRHVRPVGTLCEAVAEDLDGRPVDGCQHPAIGNIERGGGARRAVLVQRAVPAI